MPEKNGISERLTRFANAGQMKRIFPVEKINGGIFFVVLKNFSLAYPKIICSKNVKWKLQGGNFHFKTDLNL